MVNVNPSSEGIHSAILRLDDPSTVGHRLPDDEHDHRAVCVERGQRLHGRRSTRRSPDRASQHYFFNVPAEHSRVQGRLQRRPSATPGTGQAGSSAGIRSGSGSTRTPSRTATCLRRRTATARRARPVAPLQTRMAGVWEVSVDARRNSDAANGARAVPVDDVDPRRECVAGSGHHHVREHRCADRPVVHDDQPVRRVHRPSGGHEPGSARSRDPRSRM